MSSSLSCPRTRLPITIQVFESIIRGYLSSSAHPCRVLIWAIAATALFGFFRLGELLPESAAAVNPAVSLMWGDVAVDSRDRPTMVKIHLKRSKCDQFGVGADVILGRTGNALHISNFQWIKKKMKTIK